MGKLYKEEFKSVDELILKLQKHRHWRKIDKEIARDIFNQLYKNSKYIPEIAELEIDDMERIREFLIVSEEYGLVKNNFTKLAQSEVDLGLLSMFAVTLERLGASISKGYPYRHLSDDKLKSLMGMAELSYQSSILCDKYLLPSYYGVIFCSCVFLDLDRAITWKAQFNNAVKSLNSIDDSLLNYYQHSIKQDKGSINEINIMIDEKINRLKAQLK
ncbi:MAG: hypothetical protein KGZ79_08965 [Dethiobacter sp.]|jgi:hypothetical protein|nr:hypothetical protein [Dethiobacter sp.]